MNLLLNLWKKINLTNKHLKLYVTPDEKYKIYEEYNIFFRKMGKQTDLIKDIKESRVMLIPGHKAELYCLAAAEASELCIPIITMGIGALSERVNHGVTGLISKSTDDFGNNIIELYKNNDLWNELRNNLIKMRGQKSWKNAALSFLKTITNN